MGYYPLYLEMNRRRCLVVGGGAVAERKIASLLEAGAEVTVSVPCYEVIACWSKNNSIQFLARRYQRGDVKGHELVFVATNDGSVNAQVHQDGKNQGVWVNAADDPEHCDFILPSVLRRGDLTLAISSGGNSPALARTSAKSSDLFSTIVEPWLVSRRSDG